MYYVSRDDARTDVLLSGAVYAFGPLALTALLGVLGIPGLVNAAPGVQGTGTQLVGIVVTVVVTVLVPLLLMRYRKERVATVLGLGGGDASIPTGVIAALPLLVGAAVLIALQAGDPIREHPLVAILAGNLLWIVTRLVTWVGVLVLALYATVKARDAFGGDPARVEDLAWRIGRVLGIGALITTGLLAARTLVAGPGGVDGALAALGWVVWPLGVAATVWLVLKRSAGAGTTTLPTLLTPTIIGAIGNFVISFRLDALFESLYALTLSGGLGLAVGILAERTRRGGGVLVLAVLIALGSGLPAPLRLV